jgi:secreted PhoX family phosphatase
MRNHRRDFLKVGALATAAFAAEPFDALRRRGELQAAETRCTGYGPLRPARDEATGLELIRLPEGFRYISFGWTGDPLNDGAPTPELHDGMAVLQQEGSVVTVIRNHEISVPRPSIAPAEATYDPQAGAGCVRLKFDTAAGRVVSAEPALGGTHRNCAGGPTPWGTWLTCEETLDDAHGMYEGQPLPFERDHGFIFEVPAEGKASPVPLKAMGRFVHEAVAVDPSSGIVYETEDHDTAGFYRFLPTTPGKLADGGKLQMLRVGGVADARRGMKQNRSLACEWVEIAEPLRHRRPESSDTSGVFDQGQREGATTFARLEGCWFGGGKVFFSATSGGDSLSGQIWEYDPRAERLRLVFESPGAHVLDYPDNITVSPRGALVLCEDGDRKAERLCGLTVAGQLFPLAENNLVLRGEKNGFSGDFRKQEWCGATFTPDGRWLLANIQTPGLTVAITGPWGQGPL